MKVDKGYHYLKLKSDSVPGYKICNKHCITCLCAHLACSLLSRRTDASTELHRDLLWGVFLSLNISHVSPTLGLVGLPVWKFTSISLLVHEVTCLLNITAALITARRRQVAYELAVVCKWLTALLTAWSVRFIKSISKTSQPKPSKTLAVWYRSYSSLEYMETISLLQRWALVK